MMRKRCQHTFQVATSEELDEGGDAMDTSPLAEPPTSVRKRLMERLDSEALPDAAHRVGAAADGPAPMDSQPSSTLPATVTAEPAPAPKALLPAPVRPACKEIRQR